MQSAWIKCKKCLDGAVVYGWCLAGVGLSTCEWLCVKILWGDWRRYAMCANGTGEMGRCALCSVLCALWKGMRIS